MIEIFPFFPLFFRKVNIDIYNKSSLELAYSLDGKETLKLIQNTNVLLTKLNQDSKLTIAVPKDKYINVEISGKNTNKTHTQIKEIIEIIVTEDVIITITDYVEKGGE